MVGGRTSSRMNGGSEMSTQIYLFKGDGGAGLFFAVEGAGAGRCIFFRSSTTSSGRDPVEPARTRTTSWRPPAPAGASTSSQRRGQVTATERGRLALGVVRAEGHAGPLTSRGSAPSVNSDRSWSVAGSANVKGSMTSNAGIPKDDHIDADRVVARATAMAGRSTSSCTSSSASREVNQKGGYSVDPMLPTLEEPFVNSAFPKGSTILMRPKPRPSRWADGPT